MSFTSIFTYLNNASNIPPLLDQSSLASSHPHPSAKDHLLATTLIASHPHYDINLFMLIVTYSTHNVTFRNIYIYTFVKNLVKDKI